MKKILLTFSFFIVLISAFSQSAQVIWAKAMGGISNDYGKSIAADASGNVYTIGNFYGVADFNPGAGVFNLTDSGNGKVFISKLDANGNFVWAKQLGGAAAIKGNAIAIDATGNIYSIGYFNGTIDFDPNAGIYNLTSTAYEDIFISKLDANGNFVWVKQIGGPNNEEAFSINIDNNNDICILGWFAKTVDFNPGAGTFYLNNGGTFILKLNSSGDFIWAKNMEGYNVGACVRSDVSRNVFITGYFYNTVDFDPGPGISNLTSAGFKDIFISKLDADGNFLWAKKMGGDKNDEGRSLAVDAAGSVYTVGRFQSIADFDPDTAFFNLTTTGPASTDDIFISKLNASGNFVWAKQIGGLGDDDAYAITSDRSGHIYTTGFFQTKADFDPNAGSHILTATTYYNLGDIFISCLDSSGSFMWAKNFGSSTSASLGVSNYLDASGNIYITGSFGGTIDLGAGTQTKSITAAKFYDVFVLKINSIVGIEDQTHLTINKILPNPNHGLFSIEITTPLKNTRFEITNSLGELMYNHSLEQGQNSMDITNAPDGLYYVRVIAEEQTVSVQKIIKHK